MNQALEYPDFEIETGAASPMLESTVLSPQPAVASVDVSEKAPRGAVVELISTLCYPAKAVPNTSGTMQLALASTSNLNAGTELLGFETLAAISSALANEVRSPLRWVTSFSELLIREKGRTLDPVGRNYLERISNASLRLDRVMRDLQRFIAAGLQEPRQKQVSLEGAVCAVLGSHSNEILVSDAHVSLVRPLGSVLGDPDWIQQCLAQLLNNALKFVDPGESPSVRISAERRSDAVRLCVEDKGPGIAAINHERIFGLFVRLSHDFPGTGAGLALARQACGRMGGRMGVESEFGEGSRFWIELPAA